MHAFGHVTPFEESISIDGLAYPMVATAAPPAAAAVGLSAALAEQLVLVLLVSVSLNVLLVLLVLRKPLPAAPRSAVGSPPSSPRRRSREALARAQAEARGPQALEGSLADAIAQLRKLKAAQQYTEAGELLTDLRAALEGERSSDPGASAAQQELEELLADGVLDQRVPMCRAAMESLNSDNGFTLVRHDGPENGYLRVSQRLTPERELTVKIEGVLEGVRPEELIMIWREVELYPLWFPFVSKGENLTKANPGVLSCPAGNVWLHLLIETMFMDVGMPLLGFSFDALENDGCYMLIVRPVHPNTQLPAGVTMPNMSRSRKLLGSLVAYAVIDGARPACVPCLRALLACLACVPAASTHSSSTHARADAAHPPPLACCWCASSLRLAFSHGRAAE